MKLTATLMVFCVAALLALGMVMLYSSGMGQAGARYLVMQLIWCGCGLVMCGVAAVVDYRLLKKLALPILGLAVALLALVLLPHIGMRVNGARRWFGFGPVRLQPSEVGKIALIVAVAWYCDQYQRQITNWKRGIVIPGLMIGVVLGLVFVEPDRGTTILLAMVSGTMLLIAGARWRYIVPPILAGIAALGLSILHDPMRIRRIFAWLYLEENKSGVGYQAYHAMLALGSGGWFGLGLGNGQQKMGFVPEAHTDFILAVIGEELGLVATLLVVAAFITIVVCGWCIALRARDTFGFLLGAGITFLIGFQAFINIGVVTSTLPNKGLPLPFVSYGGSNLLAMLACVGVLLSIARRARLPETVTESAAGSEGAVVPQFS